MQYIRYKAILSIVVLALTFIAERIFQFTEHKRDAAYCHNLWRLVHRDMTGITKKTTILKLSNVLLCKRGLVLMPWSSYPLIFKANLHPSVTVAHIAYNYPESNVPNCC